MKIFVISLKRSKDRRKSINRQFSKLGIDFEYIDAVDGRELNDASVRECVNDGFYEDFKKMPWLTEGVVAAALSHRIAYKKIYEQKLPYALILEDDVIFSGEFLSVLKNIEGHLDEDRVITFFFQSSVKHNLLQFNKDGKIPIDKQHSLYHPTSLENFGSAAAYIISQKVAHKMYHYQDPIRSCPDWWVGFHNNQIFNDIRLVFPLVLKPGEFASTINYLKGDMLIRLSRKVIDRLPILRIMIGRRRSDRFELYQNYKFI